MSAQSAKRSIFSKPAWAPSAPPDAEEENESIFSRSVAFEDILRAKRDSKEQKARSRITEKGKAKAISDDRDVKRRRISTEEDDRREHSDSDSRVRVNRNKTDETERPPDTAVYSSPRREKTSARGAGPSPAHRRSPRQKERIDPQSTIILDDDDDADADDSGPVIVSPPPTGRKPRVRLSAEPPPELDDSSDEEDEYLRELKREAREAARLQRLGKETNLPSSLAGGGSPSTQHAHARPASAGSSSQSFRDANQTSRPEDDAVVQILIVSDIPQTKSLIVQRKASQSLRVVKELYCQKWNLDGATAAEIFFTWRGTKLFDSTTMRGIIATLKQDRRQASSDPGGQDDEYGDGRFVEDPSKGRIMLEATTAALVAEKRRLQTQRPALGLTEPAEGEGVDSLADDAAEETSRQALVVHLVAQHLEPLQLRVYSDTSVGKIMRAFAATRTLPDGKTPWLIFDGERLVPEHTVGELGLEDADEIEVILR